jgi:hypothetical protein
MFGMAVVIWQRRQFVWIDRRPELVTKFKGRRWVIDRVTIIIAVG